MFQTQGSECILGFVCRGSGRKQGARLFNFIRPVTRLTNTKLTAIQMSEKSEEEEDGLSGGEEGREGGLGWFLSLP